MPSRLRRPSRRSRSEARPLTLASRDRAELRVRAKHQEVLFDVFFRGVAPEGHEKTGALSVEGEPRLFRQMIRAFAPPAAPPGGAGKGKAVLGRP